MPTKASDQGSPIAPRQNISKVMPTGADLERVRDSRNKDMDPMILIQRKVLEQKKKDRETSEKRRASEDEIQYMSDEFKPLPIRKKMPKNPGSSPE